jgi:hypothetical protein
MPRQEPRSRRRAIDKSARATCRGTCSSPTSRQGQHEITEPIPFSAMAFLLASTSAVSSRPRAAPALGRRVIALPAELGDDQMPTGREQATPRREPCQPDDEDRAFGRITSNDPSAIRRSFMSPTCAVTRSPRPGRRRASSWATRGVVVMATIRARARARSIVCTPRRSRCRGFVARSSWGHQARGRSVLAIARPLAGIAS